jgi:hypothetical protein
MNGLVHQSTGAINQLVPYNKPKPALRAFYLHVSTKSI